MISVLSILITFSIVVFVHELGHFLTAIKLGVKVYAFSLGFGPEVFGFTYKDIRFKLSAIPIGGYVKMKGESPDEEDSRDADALMGLEPLKRIIILVSGAMMNFITGALIFSLLIFFTGIPKFIDKPVIGSVTPESPAFNAGLKPGDKIVDIDGVKVANWHEVTALIGKKGDNPVSLTVERESKQFGITVKPEMNEELGRPLIGIIQSYENVKLGLFRSFWEGTTYTVVLVWRMLVALWLMITGKMAAAVAGPVGIAQIVSKAASQGLSQLFQLIALISVNLGLINLLPIPILDGGHIMFAFFEKIKGAPLDPKKVNIASIIGLAFILTIFLFFTWQDIIRIFFK
jgi:regulator of sigma E protease